MKILKIFLIAVSLILIVYHDITISQKTGTSLDKEFLRKSFPHYTRIIEKNSPFRHWLVFSGEKFAGVIFYTEDAGIKVNGYGGPLNLIVAMNPSGKIISVELRENYETPAYLVKLKNFMKSFRGKSISEAETISTVAGATVSSRAIKESVIRASKRVAKEVLHLTASGKQPSRHIPLKVTGGILLFAAILLTATLFKKRLWRIIVDISGVIIIGFFLNLPLSIDHIFRVLELNLPDLLSGIGIVIILLVAIIPSIFGENIYCQYVCPFGALQRLEAIISPFKIQPGKKFKSKRSLIRDLILFILILLHFGLNLKGVSAIEPYSTFFTLEISGAVLIYVVVILIISFFFPMFWCTYLCPTGAFLDNIKIYSPRRKRSP